MINLHKKVKCSGFAHASPKLASKAGGAASKSPPTGFKTPQRLVRSGGKAPTSPEGLALAKSAGQRAFYSSN
jgi:hypothetical protein